jgi:hypothetical protein
MYIFYMFGIQDFELLWRTDLGILADRIRERKFEFEIFSPEETSLESDKIKEFIKTDLKVSGPKRIDDWEKGWSENLFEYQSLNRNESLIPKYFGKDPILRLQNNFIRAKNPNVEYMFFETLMDYVSIKFLENYENIYEFGCGTSHNLIRLRSLFKDIELTGLDWANSSVQIGEKILKDYQIRNLKFDFFNPDFNFIASENSSALTVAALEQVGTNFKEFINFLLSNNFKRIVHVEPINELLDTNNEIDRLSIEYSRKRNYLDGLLTHLRELEKDSKLKIVFADRSYIGSHYLDGYSIVVWEPI